MFNRFFQNKISWSQVWMEAVQAMSQIKKKKKKEKEKDKMNSKNTHARLFLLMTIFLVHPGQWLCLTPQNIDMGGNPSLLWNVGSPVWQHKLLLYWTATHLSIFSILP